MALTELQQPTKDEFYGNLQAAAGELIRIMTKLEHVYEFIDDVDVDTLNNMGVPAGVVRIDMDNFRNVLSEFVSLWNNNAVAPANNPQEMIDKIRRMTVM